MAGTWRNQAQYQSPELILGSSSEEEDESGHGSTQAYEGLQKIDDSVEDVRADSPHTGTPLQPRENEPTNRVEHLDMSDTEDMESPLIKIVKKGSTQRQRIFSDSDDSEDDVYASACSDSAAEQSIQDVASSLNSFAVSVNNVPITSTTPMGSAPAKTFNFKPKGTEPRMSQIPVLVEEQPDDGAEADDDVTESFRLLDIDDDDQPAQLQPKPHSPKRSEQPGTSSAGTAHAQSLKCTGKPGNSSEGTVDVDLDDSNPLQINDSPEVIAPVRIPPKVPAPQPLKTIFLEELPQKPVAAASSKDFLPPATDHHQVDRALTLLAKSMELVPALEEQAPTPDGFKTKLYPHQAYGLQWLWWREHHAPGGGILADEMGLGKTVMIMALVMKSLAEGSPSFEKKENDWHGSHKKLTPSRCTLIVVPPSVLGQWELEIKGKTAGLTYYVYHGPNRDKSVKKLSRFDIVLSTYSIIASEIPKIGQDERHYVGASPLVNILFERAGLAK